MIVGNRCIIPATKFVIAWVPLFISVGSWLVMLLANCVIMSIPASKTWGTNEKRPSIKTVNVCAAASARGPALSAIPCTKLPIRSTPIDTTCGTYSEITPTASERQPPMAPTIPCIPPSLYAALNSSTIPVASCVIERSGPFKSW